MKKVVAISLLVLAVFQMTQAQVNLHLGAISNTMTTTHFSNNTISADVQLYGLYGGLGFNVDLNHNFGLILGADINYYDWSEDRTVMGIVDVKTTTTQMDVAVPLMLDYSFSIGRYGKFTIMGGAMLNFGISSETRYQSVGQSWTSDHYTSSSYEDADFFAERFNWGLSCGARLGIGRIGIDAIYYKGMTDLAPAQNDQAYASKIMLGLDLNL